MIFTPLKLDGAFLIDIDPHEDERGFFARSWCAREFINNGLNPKLAQCSFSYNETAGTLRGLHFQREPYAEDKLVRCTRGAIYDVIVDIRPRSPTFKQWYAVELSAVNRRMIYVPPGFAHGFQTLRDQTEVLYMVSQSYVPEYSAGARWNDPQFSIVWPHVEQRLISVKDQNCADFSL